MAFEVHNKPRVFLSHSKLDIGFIERLYRDLRDCQIDPWLDSAEIRHGKSWMDAIFEHGIPTCDCVLIYLTENSLQSAMVKQELDAGLLQKLDDQSVSLLPYVDRTERRAELRADIRGLQAPVFNEDNYPEMLPRVVAEIWRSYLERTVEHAVQAERVKRLEAELKLRELASESADDVFASPEVRRFQFIEGELTRYEAVNLVYYSQAEDEQELGAWQFSCEVELLSLVTELGSRYPTDFRDEYTVQLLHGLVGQGVYSLDSSSVPLLEGELLMHGLLTLRSVGGGDEGAGLVTVFTDEFHRFKQWLKYHGRLPDRIRTRGEINEKLKWDW